MVMLPPGAVNNRGQQKEALAGVMFDKVLSSVKKILWLVKKPFNMSVHAFCTPCCGDFPALTCFDQGACI